MGGCQGVAMWFLRMVVRMLLRYCGWLHERCFAYPKDFGMLWVVARVLLCSCLRMLGCCGWMP